MDQLFLSETVVDGAGLHINPGGCVGWRDRIAAGYNCLDGKDIIKQGFELVQ